MGPRLLSTALHKHGHSQWTAKLRRISRTSESSSRELNLSSLASLLNGEQHWRDEQTCKEEEDEEGRPEINRRLGNLAPEELGLTFNWSTRDENQIFHKLLKLTDNIPRHNKIKNIYWLEDTLDNKSMVSYPDFTCQL